MPQRDGHQERQRRIRRQSGRYSLTSPAPSSACIDSLNPFSADFGLSRLGQEGVYASSTGEGPLKWMPPEAIDPHQRIFSLKSGTHQSLAPGTSSRVYFSVTHLALKLFAGLQTRGRLVWWCGRSSWTAPSLSGTTTQSRQACGYSRETDFRCARFSLSLFTVEAAGLIVCRRWRWW